MKKQIEAISIIVTILITFLLGYFSIEFFKSYGWSVFVFAPVLIGFLPSFIVGKADGISKKKSSKLGFVTLAFSCLGLLLFAFEGIICIIMSLPIFMLLTWIGSYLGYFLSVKQKISSSNITIILLFFSFSFMGFDYVKKEPTLIPVTTTIVVNSSVEKVWKNVVTFNKIPEPKELIFKTGISYPTDATIKGKGVGAIRYCNFTTGSFVEPITTWDEPNLLQFNVVKQPIPMNEWNPFWDIHPPHLDGYFRSYKGQFKLIEMTDNKTKLEGTTFYKVAIQPEFYWEVWSDFIIHRIHERVLNHIKLESEKKI
ncbi:hypothetical protein EQG63_08885 [Flavobacterium amnicola]|uniref:SRPBCC family protein n=1 Tax=Flavobacterium amnicola TaxID=2506422 RepID=A0A4Q1K1Y0_9FLAO|nr:hypothetical protein [Flavobacterium amnicola]RXR18372.1 hypothetical protein EQG63_08885 [Flavobacterium amnicola]